MRLALVAAVVAVVALPATARETAPTAEEAYVRAVASCVAKHSGGRYPDPVTPDQLAAPKPEDEQAAGLAQRYRAPVFQVASASGRVFRIVTDARCEVWGFGVDPAIVRESVVRLAVAPPYGGSASPEVRFEGAVVKGVVVGEMVVTTGNVPSAADVAWTSVIRPVAISR